MLDWSQEDLASACGLATTTIRRLEDGKISPREDTERVIRSAFEKEGLEFITDGVRKRKNEMTTFNGEDSRHAFYKDIMRTVVSGQCDEIYAVTRSQEGLADIFYQNTDWMKRLLEFSRIKCLVENNDASVTGLERIQFRKIVIRQYLVPLCFVYGNKHVMVRICEKNRFSFIVVSEPSMSYYFRDQFNALWKQSEEIV